MANDIGLTIPFDTRKDMQQDVADISRTNRNIERGILSWVDLGNKSNQERFERNQKFIEEFFSPILPTPEEKQTKKKRKKLTEFYEKHIMKNKFFSTVINKLTTVGKKLANLAGGSFWKLLIGLIALAIFDPKGKLLSSLLNVIGKALTHVLKTISKYLPIVIKNIINLIKNVLPKLITNFIKNFFPQLSNIFKDLAKQLKKDAPILSWLFEQLGESFAKDGALYKFAMMLGKLSPVLITGFLALGGIVKLFGILSKLAPILKGLVSAFSLLSKVGPPLFTALKGLGTFLVANPIVAVLAGVVLAFAAIYKYSEKVSKKSGEMIKNIEDMQKSSSFFESSVGQALNPIRKFLVSLQGVADWFTFVKKEGWGAGFKQSWNRFVKSVKTIPEDFKKAPETIKKGFQKNTIEPIKKWFTESKWGIALTKKATEDRKKFNKTTGKWFSDAVSSIKNFFKKDTETKGFFESWLSKLSKKAKKDRDEFNKTTGKWFSDIFKNIKNKFLDIRKSIKKWFSDVFKNIKNKFLDIGKSIKKWFLNIYKTIKNKLSNMGKPIKEWFNITTKKYKKYFSFMKDWWKNIINKITTSFKTIKNKISSIFDKIKNLIISPFEKIFNFFNKNAIKEISSKIKNGFKDISSLIWEKLKNSFGNIFEIIAKPFKAIMKPIKSLINKLSPLLKFIINTFNSLRDTFSAFISSPWQFLRKQEEQSARVLTARIARESGGDADINKIIKIAKGDTVKDATPKEKYIATAIKKETGKEGFKALTEKKTETIIKKVRVSKFKDNNVSKTTSGLGA